MIFCRFAPLVKRPMSGKRQYMNAMESGYEELEEQNRIKNEAPQINRNKDDSSLSLVSPPVAVVEAETVRSVQNDTVISVTKQGSQVMWYNDFWIAPDISDIYINIQGIIFNENNIISQQLCNRVKLLCRNQEEILLSNLKRNLFFNPWDLKPLLRKDLLKKGEKKNKWWKIIYRSIKLNLYE